MRWPVKPGLKEGQTRERIRFAWLPRECGSVVVWLERFVLTERVVRCPFDGVPIPFPRYYYLDWRTDTVRTLEQRRDALPTTFHKDLV